MDAGWLEAHLTDPAVRIVEVDVSRAAHDQWHIGQAALWNVYTDLKDSDYRLVGPEAVGSCWRHPGSRRRRRWCSTATRPLWGSG